MDAPEEKLASARKFLNALFCRYYASGGQGLIECRLIKKGLGGKDESESTFTEAAEISLDDFSYFLQKNREGHNVHVGVNPRPQSRAKTKADIVDVVCLWADVDGKAFEDKAEARRMVDEFELKPSILVDSGNGYHCYWVLAEPIINRTEAQSREIEEILNGLTLRLKSDRQPRDFCRVLRLPGTENVKNPAEPKPCDIVWIDEDRAYSLQDFSSLKRPVPHVDEAADGGDAAEEFDFEDEGEKLLVDSVNAENALKQVEELGVSQKIVQMIKSGECSKDADADRSRSGRDMTIISALVAAGYGSATIRSVCLNPYLGCSDRFRAKGRAAAAQLNFEIWKAQDFIGGKGRQPARIIARIRSTPNLKADMRLEKICKLVVSDLFKRRGAGYKNEAEKTFYFFEKDSKRLMDIGSTDFACYLKDLYELPEKHTAEVLSWIRREIWKNGLAVIPRSFAYFDDARGVLYVSDQGNRVFRLDGQGIRPIDNGSEGVFFRCRGGETPLSLNLSAPGTANYCRDGFDLEKFVQESLLFKYVVNKARFAVEEAHHLSAEEQKHLLVILVLSYFFESLQRDKPIPCFTGVKASGKSFVLAAIGKLLFGPAFELSHVPDSVKDFKVGLGGNYFIAYDNVDSVLKPDYINAFCVAATGGKITARKLYSDSEEIQVTPSVFLALTTRDMRFRRDDFVDRLMIFNTEKIANPVSKGALFGDIMDNRAAIWEELLVNLNELVKLLNRTRGWNPPGIFRIADFELFGKRIHGEAGRARFVCLLEKMNKEKSDFSLEDDPAYIVLRHICVERRDLIFRKTGAELFDRMEEAAEGIHLDSFRRRYQSAKSLCRRLANVKDELSSEFNITIQRGGHNIYRYTIKAKGAPGGDEEPEETESPHAGVGE